MKTIGILGGMSWPSTLDYYRVINKKVNEQLGGANSAQMIVHSCNFAEIKILQEMAEKKPEYWTELGLLLGQNANDFLKSADFIVIATNTMHKVADIIEECCNKKILHIADATADAINKEGIKRIGLLGTRFTMREDFYKQKLQSHGIEVVVPDEEGITTVNKIIFDELINNIVRPQSATALRKVIADLINREKCEGIVLGCTELPLFFPNDECCYGKPLFKTAEIHAEAVAKFALAK